MATRSLIGVENADGSVRYTYCHFDGYPEGVGRQLVTHFADRGAAEKLATRESLRSIVGGEPESLNAGDGPSEAASRDVFYAAARDCMAEWIYLWPCEPRSAWVVRKVGAPLWEPLDGALATWGDVFALAKAAGDDETMIRALRIASQAQTPGAALALLRRTP